ncbi:nucleolar protein [Dimargaris verticillata]|uniref:Nucleolar protein n=1 Tax=Dimargaris verticillata TaxID=2761393 RepID=A0A9W8B0U1_9FUNG|nr:nucleolar protein [Dimargaris verticillata]
MVASKRKIGKVAKAAEHAKKDTKNGSKKPKTSFAVKDITKEATQAKSVVSPGASASAEESNEVEYIAVPTDNDAEQPDEPAQINALVEEALQRQYHSASSDDESEDGTAPDRDDEDAKGANDDASSAAASRPNAVLSSKMKERLAQVTAKEGDRGVMYIGRIPHGFYEDEMRKYFGQFGRVTRLVISRNKQTGKSRHYGFIEFAHKEVAQVVAQTMHNYLLSGRLLQCAVVPPEKVHPQLFRDAGRKIRPVNRALVEKSRLLNPRTAQKITRAQERMKRKDQATKEKLDKFGIAFEFPQPAIKAPFTGTQASKSEMEAMERIAARREEKAQAAKQRDEEQLSAPTAPTAA